MVLLPVSNWPHNVHPSNSITFLPTSGQETGQHLWTGSFKHRSHGPKAGVAWSWRGSIIQRRQSPGILDVGPVWAKEELSLNG